MDQISVRGRARVPAITCGSSATSSRLDRHLAVLAGPAVPHRQTEEATSLVREITSRRAPGGRTRNRGARVALFAPLSRLKRSLFGGHA